MENLFIDCWLLDAVDDDFTAVWELASILHHRQLNASKDDILNQLTSRLSHLQSKNMIQFYEAILFNGDEIEIKPAINKLFIKLQIADSLEKDIDKPLVKAHITEIGRAFYLRECNPYVFI